MTFPQPCLPDFFSGFFRNFFASVFCSDFYLGFRTVRLPPHWSGCVGTQVVAKLRPKEQVQKCLLDQGFIQVIFRPFPDKIFGVLSQRPLEGVGVFTRKMLLLPFLEVGGASDVKLPCPSVGCRVGYHPGGVYLVTFTLPMGPEFGGRDEVPTRKKKKKKSPKGTSRQNRGHLFLLRMFFQEIGTICWREMSGTPIHGRATIFDVPNWL